MPERHNLTELQLAIVRLLWEKTEATVAELWEALHAQRGLAPTTVATTLSRLHRRGVLARRTRDRQYVYRARVSEPDVRYSMVSELTDKLFAGDVAALVSHLVNEQEMSPGDLERVRHLIQHAERKGSSK